MASTNNPIAGTPSPSTIPTSKRYNIAGIAVDVLGLPSLPPSCTSLSILYLLHPRLQKASTMIPIGTHIINAWTTHLASLPPSHPSKNAGLLAVTFDQRNHGARLVDSVANDAWREGNPRHAQDMFGVYNGTVVDTSLLIDHVGSYLAEDFEGEMPPIERNLVLGVSLGGHAAWQVLFADPRVEAGVVVIGCPDYMRRPRSLASFISVMLPDTGIFWMRTQANTAQAS
jgi:pimeloyl-ACP methyl ester carboxylesterase